MDSWHCALINGITLAIGGRQALNGIFRTVLTRLENDLPIDFGCVCLYAPPAEFLTVATVGARGKVLAERLQMTEQSQLTIGQNGLARCLRGDLVYEPDLALIGAPLTERCAAAGLGSMVVAPLLAESSVFGLLLVARSEPRAFSSDDCEFLQQLSEHVGRASHQTELFTALQTAYDDLRQSQQAALQQERLSALAQMANGIALDINNAISPVLLYAESLLAHESNLSDRARDYLRTIQHAIEDVAQTVAQMREFCQPRELQLVLAQVDLNSLARQAIELTRARWRDIPQKSGVVIELKTELAEALPEIMGAESEIRDAFTNLILNAVDAMPQGGVLSLRTRLATSDLPGAEPLRHVAVEVRDTGVGMDEETRRRCLEPFYSTKGERGTGLGLAMVFGMVKRHGAHLEIDSAKGAGTTMRLIFLVPGSN